MTNLPIVDAHVHLWDPQQTPMPWLADIPALNRPYGLREYGEQAAGAQIVGMVYVEVGVAPHYALLEAQQMAALATRDARLQGVVAAAPLDDGERARGYLEALRALGPSVKGVRRNLQDETDISACLTLDFLKATRLLPTYDLTFDICVRHHQLPAVAAFVEQCPDVTFVLDHLGKPPVSQRALDPWRDNLARLAASPNVSCKVSGLLTEADLRQWRPAEFVPYIEHALAVFGAERVLYGGDWPVLLQAGSYQQWLVVVGQVVANLPLPEQHAFWRQNAQRIYRLNAGEDH